MLLLRLWVCDFCPFSILNEKETAKVLQFYRTRKRQNASRTIPVSRGVAAFTTTSNRSAVVQDAVVQDTGIVDAVTAKEGTVDAAIVDAKFVDADIVDAGTVNAGSVYAPIVYAEFKRSSCETLDCHTRWKIARTSLGIYFINYFGF